MNMNWKMNVVNLKQVKMQLFLGIKLGRHQLKSPFFVNPIKALPPYLSVITLESEGFLVLCRKRAMLWCHQLFKGKL